MKKIPLAILAFSLLFIGSPLSAGRKVGEGDREAPKSSGRRDLRIFRLSTVSFADIEAVAGDLLSPDGKIIHIRSTDSVVVVDYRDNLEAVERLIKALEGGASSSNILIEVSFDETGESGDRGWEVDPGWPIVIEDGKVRNPRVQVRARHETVRHAQSTRQQVLTRDGGEARIWVGETVVEPLWVYEYGWRRGWWRSEFVDYDFGASLWVRPKLRPDGLIEIDVFPRLTSRTGRRHSVDVKELAVSILARDGQTVGIGGLDEDRREAYGKIFGRGKIFSGSSLSITLTPRVQPMTLPPSAAAAAD